MKDEILINFAFYLASTRPHKIKNAKTGTIISRLIVNEFTNNNSECDSGGTIHLIDKEIVKHVKHDISKRHNKIWIKLTTCENIVSPE